MKLVTAKSFFLCGTVLYGWRPAPGDRHIVTRWVAFVGFPIVPVGSYAIDFTKDRRVPSDYFLSMFGFDRDALEGEAISPLCWRQVINTYLYVYLPWAIALSLGPFVPHFAAGIMASLIVASWFFAGIMMRRVLRQGNRGGLT
jgi:hypothetical protein